MIIVTDSRPHSFAQPLSGASFDSVGDRSLISLRGSAGPPGLPFHFAQSMTQRPALSTTLAPVEKLKKDLPWIATILKNDIITTSQGYK